MKIVILALFISISGYASKFSVSKESVEAASKIDWVGVSTRLLGESNLKEGDTLPSIKIINAKNDSRTNYYKQQS